MSQMPERVWLTPDPYAMSGDWWADGKTVREEGEVPYVPEQRALDAERERDEANKELLLLHAQYRQISNLEALRVREIAALRTERDALRADLLALVTALERLVLAGRYLNIAEPRDDDANRASDHEEFYAANRASEEVARAILARVATEDAS